MSSCDCIGCGTDCCEQGMDTAQRVDDLLGTSDIRMWCLQCPEGAEALWGGLTDEQLASAIAQQQAYVATFGVREDWWNGTWPPEGITPGRWVDYLHAADRAAVMERHMEARHADLR